MANKKKKTSAGKIVLFAVEIVALIALLVLMLFVLRATDEEEGVEHISIVESEIKMEMPEEVKKNETMKGYRNIALFGVDSRKEQLASGTRSDTIMIASINLDTKEVKLLSVYRDTYLNLMGSYGTYSKCNVAYRSGGGTQAIKMLNANLDMDITDFITIGFEGLRDVVDALGGVYIDVDANEIKHLNNYQIAMTESMSDIDTFTAVTDTGYQLLNGLQATAYCRIRYTSGGDYKRTERQREVIKACLEVAKTISPTKLASICETIFGEVCTSLDLTDILEVLKDVTQYTIVDDSGFPAADMITTAYVGSKGDCVIPLNLESNVKWAHKFLFGEEDYNCSETVKEISAKIEEDVSPYLKK